MWSKLLHPDLVQKIRAGWQGLKDKCRGIKEGASQVRSQPGLTFKQTFKTVTHAPLKVWHLGVLLVGHHFLVKREDLLLGPDVVKVLPSEAPGRVEFWQAGDPRKSYDAISQDIWRRSRYSTFPHDWVKNGDIPFAILMLNHIIDRMVAEKRVPPEVVAALGKITSTPGVTVIDDTTCSLVHTPDFGRLTYYNSNSWADLIVTFMKVARGTHHEHQELADKVSTLRALAATFGFVK